MKEKSAKKAASKTKYTCHGCGLKVWGKPDIRLMCSDCDLQPEADEG
jgi:hypothetical protein